MDFSPWDIENTFRLHIAACLIAGVMPLSKRFPDADEIPAAAKPAYKQLLTAYVLGTLLRDKPAPKSPDYPKEKMLAGIPLEAGEALKHAMVSRKELCRWIEATGIKSAYSFGPQQDSTQPLAAQTDTVPASVRYDLLATRAELVAAFSMWGLNLCMFKNLTERKWLMDARKVKGQGQRGKIIEPLFCPFEVMRGLATKTKKPRFSEEKGWDVLENRFRNVFEENQQFDPREQTG